MTDKSLSTSPHAVASPGANRPPGKLRVLVVEDNVDTGRTLSMLLRVKGHETCLASDGLEAIDRTAEFRPHVILMDIEMPNLNGFEATRRIRELPFGGHIHITAVTGFTEPTEVDRARDAGCSSYLSKPVDFLALDRLLKSIAATIE